MKKKYLSYIIGLFALLPAGCSDEDAPASNPPTIIAEDATDITRTTATVSCSIQAEAGSNIKEFGVEYSITASMDYEHTERIPLTYTASQQHYSVPLSGLMPNTTYHFRFYASNGVNTVYDSGRSFITERVGPPVLEEITMTRDENKVTVSSRILDEGGGNIVAFGFKIKMWKHPAGMDEDEVEINLKDKYEPDKKFSYTFDMEYNTSYEIYAYAVNSTNKEDYTGSSLRLSIDEVSYSSPQLNSPQQVGDSQEESLTLQAQIFDFGTSSGKNEIKAIGFAYKVENTDEEEKEVPVDLSQLNEDGTFSGTLTGLKPATIYEIRAYAENDANKGGGKSYSYYTTIETATPLTPSLTMEVKEFDFQSITVSASLQNENELSGLTEIGFYLNENKQQVKLETLTNGQYSMTFTNLASNTSYSVQAYAVNKGVSEGRSDRESVTTLRFEKPKVSILSYEPGEKTITLQGYIYDKGSDTYPITGIGFAYKNKNGGTEQQIAVDLSELDENYWFKCTITGLSPETEYEVRAYAINGRGTGYSDYQTVKTLELAAPQLTITYDKNSLNDSSVSVTATISSIGRPGATIVEAGFCWSETESYPTFEHNFKEATVNDNNMFSSTITGLKPKTTYHIRAYAKSSINGENYIGYSNVIDITTYGEGIPDPDDNPSPDIQ